MAKIENPSMGSPFSPGTKLGRYEIRSQIGAGGMGEVYLAHDTQLDRTVALKILPENVAADRTRLQRFVQEAKAASALNHPNILTIFEIGHTDSTHFIATEFIEGETLRQHMRGAHMKLSEVLNVAIQIADALSAAHEAGIIHRDIKPENIMLRRRDAYVKVLDFGLAKLIEQPLVAVDTEAATKSLFQTDAGVVLGTVIYMSPEQARGSKVDARTDIWSLGIVLYEMVAGCLPFEGSTTSEILASILNEKAPPPLARFAREVPAELERIVEKALRKDREERYQTSKDMLLDLRRLKHKLEVDAEIERTAPPDFRGTAGEAKPSGDQEGVSTAQASAAQAATLESARTASSAEYVHTEIRRHKRGALLLLAALVAVTAAVAYFAYWRSAGEGGAGQIRSIAVLPFTNADGNPDAEYLSDGISESLINSLSQLPGVKVIARSSSFRYKGKEVDPQEVANALGVEAILTGRVVQRGDNLLISAELVNASDKTNVWGDQYNRKATDVLQVQSEISREIAEKLRLRLTASARQQLAKPETANPQAYELLLKARFYRDKGGSENEKKAIEYLKQATAVDPGYAPAYAQLSEGYRALVVQSVLDPKVGMPQAEAAARKALELDESLANAHFALAGIKLDGWDWATAEREYKRAIELNPNLQKAHGGYSRYLSVMGRHDESLAEIKRTRELDPLSPIANTAVGERLRYARQYDQAIEALKKTLERDQNFPNMYFSLGHVYMAKGQYAEAIAAYQEAIRLGRDTSSTNIYLGAAYARGGERERAQAILKRLQTSNEYVSPAQLAVLYAALGEREQAFASLEKAYVARDLVLQFLGVDPAYDSLRSDPRFQDLLRRVGLPQ
jgi:serine/threonine protein kinase/TolB-like protein/Tfp pilus assembly protein PilF